MRLPPCQHVPTIDGEVKPGEWDEAFAGFGLIGERRAARYFLTYDGRTLYAAMQTELPPWGRIDGKIRRLPFEVFQDDHFELHINPPREPEDPDKAYYQLVGNARDCFWNSQHTEQNPGFLPFNGDWTFRNSVKDGWWTWELSTPVHALGKARITPETTWGFKFVRCWHQPHAENFWPSGGYFDRSSYFQVALDASAPVVQLEDFGKWWEGRSDIVLGLRNLTVRPLAVKAFFRLEGGGTEARTLEQEATLAAWDPAASPAPPRETVRFSQSWAAGKEASLSLRVTSPDGQKVYFSDVRPFPKPPDGPLWVAAVEKKEEIAFRAFFYPGVSRLRCEVSFGHLKQASAVTRALLVVMDAGGGEITRSEATRFIEGDADPLIPLPPGLPQGRYEVRLSLFAGDQQVAGPLTDSFEKKSFRFEGNRLGVSEQVLPPWTPLVVNPAAHRISCWGRDYTLDGGGLPAQVRSQAVDLLAAPVALAARSGGVELPWEKRKIEYTRVSPHEVEFNASSSCPKLQVGISGHAEYDGMVRYEMELSPLGDGQLDSLDLLVALRKDAVTLMHGVSDGCRTNTGGIVPEGDGRVWDSTQVGNWSLTGTFIPYLWIGNERMGLCWWADKDEGWIRPEDRKSPVIEVVRVPGEVRMVFRLFARPVKLAASRRIVFAFEGTPVRPRPGWARTASIFSSQNPHAPGPRFTWYGSTCWALSGTDRYRDIPYTFTHLRPVDRECEVWLMKRMEQIHQGGGLGLAYTDYRARNYSEETKYYAWEWSKNGASLPKEQVAAARISDGLEVDSAASRLDYDLWCLNENMKLGMDAWYFDEIQCTADRNVAAGRGWLNEQGEVEGECTLFPMRSFLKRLYTLMVERGQSEPLIALHMTSTAFAGPFAFATTTFDYEYGQEDPNRRVLLLLGLDGFRATAMGHPYGLVGTVINTERNSPYLANGDWQPLRNWVGMQLLHDLNLQVNAHVGGILKEFGYYEPDCRFIGYWEAHGKLYDVEPENIKVSVFRRGRRALLVFLNTANQDTLALWRPKPETGMTSNLWDADPAFGYTFWWTWHDERGFRKVFVPRYDYRLVFVDCGGDW
ncbi:MAG: hypothetical protein HYU43_00030 [Armatimonadetes bacterium]|nr:hypothetical protein [Armatimonadota bacterium]